MSIRTTSSSAKSADSTESPETQLIVTPPSGRQAEMVDGVYSFLPREGGSFFDDKYHIMEAGHNARGGEWKFAYEQQVSLLESYIKPGMVVLDIGCGPSLPYACPKGSVVFGLDPSFYSIRQNAQVTFKLHASATDIPLADASVDLIVCFYSIHHMIGPTIESTRKNVRSAFTEFARVLRPGRLLFVYEMTPMHIFSLLQRLTWNMLIKILHGKLDMYFWSAGDLVKLGEETLPGRAQIEKIYFDTTILTWFPPVFALPWFKIPRLLYPLDPKLYRWKMPE
jgi:ubiquinone/menaquinone biosynthesis C-methylase UbiE